MTESQRKFLTGYLGECWHDISGGISEDMMSLKCGVCGKWLHILDIELYCQRTFTEPKDKQDLLEAIIRKNEWYSVVWDMNGELMESQSGEFAGFKNYAKSFLFALSDSNESFTIKLIQLSPIETAELICKWKGVE